MFNNKSQIEDRFKKHWDKFTKYSQERDKPLLFFQNQTLTEYVKASVYRMNEYSPKPGHKEPWQNNLFDPITRNKLVTILSKIAASRMQPNLFLKSKNLFKNSTSKIRQSIYKNLLEAANDKNNEHKQLIFEMYQAMSEGTIIGYEDWKKDTRKVEYVKDYNPETGDIETETIEHDTWDDVFGEIVPLKEFYPETIWVGSMDKLKRAFRKKEMTYEQFMDVYGKFKNAQDVQPKSSFFDENGMVEWGISSDIQPENVEVLQYYDESDDKLGLWANGKEIYYGPLPWDHKKLPFWHSQFEIIHVDFFYGKSLPDKMKSMQDVNNGVFNNMLDQLLLSLKSPIFVNGSIDDIDDDYLEPGKIYSIDPDAQIQRGSLGNIDTNAYNMLDLIKRSISESSVSPQAQGIPSGGRKTKYEVETLNEGAMNLASLFLQIIENSIPRKYYLRMYNILQYYSQPSSDDKYKFKFIKRRDTLLSNGKKGDRYIQIVGSRNEVPTRGQLKRIAALNENKDPEEFNVFQSNVEPIVITRDYLLNREFELEMRVVPNSSIKESESQKKRSDVAFYQMTQGDPYFDQIQIKKDLANSFDKNPDLVSEPQQGVQEQRQSQIDTDLI